MYQIKKSLIDNYNYPFKVFKFKKLLILKIYKLVYFY